MCLGAKRHALSLSLETRLSIISDLSHFNFSFINFLNKQTIKCNSICGLTSKHKTHYSKLQDNFHEDRHADRLERTMIITTDSISTGTNNLTSNDTSLVIPLELDSNLQRGNRQSIEIDLTLEPKDRGQQDMPLMSIEYKRVM